MAGIDLRTLQRWPRQRGIADRRRSRPTPIHALSEAERAHLLAVTNKPRFSAMPSARIVPILAARHALYLQARQRHPTRWADTTRNWVPVGAVTLNPERDSVIKTHLTGLGICCIPSCPMGYDTAGDDLKAANIQSLEGVAAHTDSQW